MSTIWTLAERLNTVPREADAVMRLRSRAWWELPRTFGCSHAKTADPWFAVYPMPDIFCGHCALRVLDETTTCLYCAKPVDDTEGEHVVHEARDFLVLLSVAHCSCLEAAR